MLSILTLECVSLLLLLLLLLRLLLGLVMALDHDQIVIAVRGDHHVVHLARHSQKCQVVLRVQVSNQTASSYGKLRKTDSIGGSFS